MTRRTAYRLWAMGLGVQKLAPNDTDMPVEKYGDLNPNERVFYGIEKPVWKNYLKDEKSMPYLYARKVFCDAASKVANEDMSSVDERFTIDFSETNFKERMALGQYLADKESPDANALSAYVPELLDEFSSRLWGDVLHEYGWDESSMPRAIAGQLAEPALQKAAMELLSRETEREDGSPLYEDNLLDLPAQDDVLTVLAVQPDLPLSMNSWIPDVKLLKNEEIGRWYVLTRSTYAGERLLKAGDKPTLKELGISAAETDPDVFRTFYNENEARSFYEKKVNYNRSFGQGGSKESRQKTDYEREVIQSVNMSLMNYLAFYSGGNVEQMTRIFATSGLYRPDKPASYYEYTAIKAAKDTPHYTPPRASNSAPKAVSGGNGKA